MMNPPATPEISTLSLHDALPIWIVVGYLTAKGSLGLTYADFEYGARYFFRPLDLWYSLIKSYCFAAVLEIDRKSTRLNSSHANISYAVFCLKQKKRIATGPYEHL